MAQHQTFVILVTKIITFIIITQVVVQTFSTLMPATRAAVILKGVENATQIIETSDNKEYVNLNSEKNVTKLENVESNFDENEGQEENVNSINEQLEDSTKMSNDSNMSKESFEEAELKLDLLQSNQVRIIANNKSLESVQFDANVTKEMNLPNLVIKKIETSTSESIVEDEQRTSRTIKMSPITTTFMDTTNTQDNLTTNNNHDIYYPYVAQNTSVDNHTPRILISANDIHLLLASTERLPTHSEKSLLDWKQIMMNENNFIDSANATKMTNSSIVDNSTQNYYDDNEKLTSSSSKSTPTTTTEISTSIMETTSGDVGIDKKSTTDNNDSNHKANVWTTSFNDSVKIIQNPQNNDYASIKNKKSEKEYEEKYFNLYSERNYDTKEFRTTTNKQELIETSSNENNEQNVSFTPTTDVNLYSKNKTTNDNNNNHESGELLTKVEGKRLVDMFSSETSTLSSRTTSELERHSQENNYTNNFIQTTTTTTTPPTLGNLNLTNKIITSAVNNDDTQIRKADDLDDNKQQQQQKQQPQQLLLSEINVGNLTTTTIATSSIITSEQSVINETKSAPTIKIPTTTTEATIIGRHENQSYTDIDKQIRLANNTTIISINNNNNNSITTTSATNKAIEAQEEEETTTSENIMFIGSTTTSDYEQNNLLVTSSMPTVATTTTTTTTTTNITTTQVPLLQTTLKQVVIPTTTTTTPTPTSTTTGFFAIDKTNLTAVQLSADTIKAKTNNNSIKDNNNTISVVELGKSTKEQEEQVKEIKLQQQAQLNIDNNFKELDSQGPFKVNVIEPSLETSTTPTTITITTTINSNNTQMTNNITTITEKNIKQPINAFSNFSEIDVNSLETTTTTITNNIIEESTYDNNKINNNNTSSINSMSNNSTSGGSKSDMITTLMPNLEEPQVNNINSLNATIIISTTTPITLLTSTELNVNSEIDNLTTTSTPILVIKEEEEEIFETTTTTTTEVTFIDNNNIIIEETTTPPTPNSKMLPPTVLTPTSAIIDGVNDIGEIQDNHNNNMNEFNIMTTNLADMSNSNNLHTKSTDANGMDVNVIIAISVSVVGVIALVLLVAFLYLIRKRQKQMSYAQRCHPATSDAYSLDNVSVFGSLRRKGAAARASKRIYGNAAFDDPSLRHNVLTASELAKFIEKRSNIFEEFRDVPEITARVDEVPIGCEDKNRYANIVPLPETRVGLLKLDNDEKSEYINANYVRGPSDGPNYYIACQAPLESTVADFWRMIWEQKSRVLIQATDLVEHGKDMCAEYLPPSVTLDNHTTYGNYQVTLKSREVKDKYAISILLLRNTLNEECRELTHYWYKWPETGVPTDEAPVIAMLLEARASLKAYCIEEAQEYKIKTASNLSLKSINDESILGVDPNGNNTDKNSIKSNLNGSTTEINGNLSASERLRPSSQKTQGPLIVHCSPGTGRTGTIIACDMAIRSLETPKRSVDIPQLVYFVRRGRASAVKTKEQYEFIYKVAHMYATKITNFSQDN